MHVLIKCLILILFIVFLGPINSSREHQTLLFRMDIKKRAMFSIHGYAVYKVPYPFYLVDILFLQVINISILLHTFTALICFLGLF